MECRGFVPKVKQLEQIAVEMDDNDEQVMKINSKKKYIENKPAASRKMPIFGGNNRKRDDSEESPRKKPTAFGLFEPVNKNEL
jgi:hypothetical protein